MYYKCPSCGRITHYLKDGVYPLRLKEELSVKFLCSKNCLRAYKKMILNTEGKED